MALPDPLSPVTDRVHRRVIEELAPQLVGGMPDPSLLRERVIAAIEAHLAGEDVVSEAERETVARAVADDILGRGPLESLLVDDSVGEIVVAGPDEVWVEREGKLFFTSVRFRDEAHLRRILEKLVEQVGRPVGHPSAMLEHLPDGSRIMVLTPRRSPSAPLVLIRKRLASQ